MQTHSLVRRAGWIGAVLAASLLVAPMASARVHVGVGIAVPGLSIGVGNCWNCGYVAAPPVYYPPAYYPAPVYYPAPAYYAAPAYYGYGYYGPSYPRVYYRGYDRWHHGHDRDDHDWRDRGYYRHGHD